MEDFKEYKGTNFRQLIHKLRTRFEVVQRSRPVFYKIKGIRLPGDSHKITHEVKGDNIISILQNLKDQPPKIHDLKLKFNSKLHQILIELGYECHVYNKSIILEIPNFDNNIRVKMLVYPLTVQIDIGCTYKPFVYDISGMVNLVFLLGMVYHYIHRLIGYKIEIPYIGEWMVTHYHFGKDGTETYSGQSYNRTFDDLANGLIRFYSKKMQDGTTISRIEQIKRPDSTLAEEIDKMINSELTSYENHKPSLGLA